MADQSSIKSITAQELLDSRGNPTVEAIVVLESGVVGSAIVPSGASTGTYEAHELRDGNIARFGGKGVLKAVGNVNAALSELLIGMNVTEQRTIDSMMVKQDGTEHKEKIGANALLAVSLACARAGAASIGAPLYCYLRDTFWPSKTTWIMPTPLMNVLNGGKHAIGSVDMQEFMIVPVGAPTFSEALRKGVEVYHALKELIHTKGLSVGVGDEGGFMPKLSSHTVALETLVAAVVKAGYKLGTDFGIALDPAASEFYQDGMYNLSIEKKKLSSEQMIDMYSEWINAFPILSIEDGLSEDDWDGFSQMTRRIGGRVQIVGDDLFVTNYERLDRGIAEHAANSILVKLNQIGTLTETADVITKAHNAGMTAIISHRSGETEDTFIADLAVASNAGQIKTGAPTRTERVAKYNQLLRIEKMLSECTYYGWKKA